MGNEDKEIEELLHGLMPSPEPFSSNSPQGMAELLRVLHHEELEKMGTNPFEGKDMNTDATDIIIVMQPDSDKFQLIIKNLNLQYADVLEGAIKGLLPLLKLIK